MKQLEQHASSATARPASHVTSFIHALVLLGLFAAGFAVRGFLPAGPPAGAGPEGGEAGAKAPLVQRAIVSEGPAKAPEKFIGHIEAIQEVALCAQVAGYLEAVNFKEGAYVKEGALLFKIEQGPYQARVDLSAAALAQAKAGLSAAQAELDRAQKLLQKYQRADARSVSKTDVDSAENGVKQGTAAVAQAEAAIQQAEANLDLAKIDLGYTALRSPIAGRIGKALLTKGNYVSPASGPLAHIVQLNPVRVLSSLPDRKFLDILMEAQAGDNAEYDLRLLLPNGAEYPLSGFLDFEDNKMDERTGTIAVRARFENPDDLLIPGSFVTILAQSADTARLPLIPQKAVLNDKEGASVFVIKEGEVLEQRRVTLGEPIGDQQIVREGLAAGEAIVVEGLQKVKDGATVRIKNPAPQAP